MVAREQFSIGARIRVDGMPAVVQMETSTSLLVRDEKGAEQWVHRKSSRLAAADGTPLTASEREALPPQAPQVGEKRRAAAAEPGAEDREEDECFFCGNGGKLICCDVCPRVYHMRCLPPEDAEELRRQGKADEDWWCPRCQRMQRAVFAMTRQLNHPSVGTDDAPVDDVANTLFAYMCDEQHEGQWEALRDAGTGLLHAMPTTIAWQAQEWLRPAESAARQAADQLAARVSPTWWQAGEPLVEGDEGDEGPPPSAAHGAEGAADGVGARPTASPSPGLRATTTVSNGSTASGGESTGAGGGGGGSPAPPRISTSNFRGVSKRYGRYKARIKQNGSDTVIGDFDDEIEAARAYDRKAREIHGEKALVNFPDEHWNV